MYARRQLRDDSQVLLEVGLDDVAQSVVVLEAPDLLHLSECVERIVVKIIYIVDMTIRDDDIRQLLHVAYAMCQS